VNAVLPATDPRADDNEKERCSNSENLLDRFLRTRQRGALIVNEEEGRSMVRGYSRRKNTGMERRAGGLRQMEKKDNKGAY